MEISSISSTSLTHPSTQQSGTKVANQKEVMSEANPSLQPSRSASWSEQVQSMSEQRVEQTQKLIDVQNEQKERLEKLVVKLDEFMSSFNKGLSFRMDEASGRSVVTVYELSSGDVIRQIPEKEMLELAQQLSLHARGFVQEKV